MKKGVITGDEKGLKIRSLKTTDVKEGRTYFFGASSTPDLIYIEDVSPNWITYRKYPYYPSDKCKIERDMGEDLIAEGNETMRGSYREKFIGEDLDLKEIQDARIKFKIKESALKKWDNPARAIERRYRSKYGLETNMGAGNHVYETDVRKKDVSKIRDLPEIRVLESGEPRRYD